MCRYPEVLQLVEKDTDKASASDTAAEKGELGITFLSSVLLLESEKQNGLLFIKAVAVHRKSSTKEKSTVALFRLYIT